MPVLESTENVDIAPKSIIRHRPIGEAAGKKVTRDTLTEAPVVQRASRPRPADVEHEVAEWKRSEPVPAPRRSERIKPSAPLKDTAPAPRSLPRRWNGRVHPLLYLGVGMMAMLLLFVLISAFVGWLNTTLDDIHYGRPRTFQTDAFVGHNENGVPSHFIAINLNRHIEVIEMPGGDASHARIYLGPQLYGPNDDLTPVTLRFLDVNNDHKPDMIISFQGTRVVFINDQGGFRPMLPSEHDQVEQFLQHLG